MIKSRIIMSKARVGVDRNVKIPKSILGKYNVKAGDVVTIQAMNGSIVLAPEKAKSRNFHKKVNGRSKNSGEDFSCLWRANFSLSFSPQRTATLVAFSANRPSIH